MVFLALNPSGPAARGWAIPMATDPAFAVGALALLGSRVPAGAKAFLLALAVVDDIAAVTVIAVAYTSQLALGWLAVAAVGVLAGGLLLRVPVLPLWCWGLLGLLGLGVWWAAWRSGCMPPSPGSPSASPSRPARSGAAPDWSCWRAGCIWSRPTWCAGLLGAAVLLGARASPTN